MSVNISIGSITLDNHMYWTDYTSHSVDEVSHSVSVWGVPIIYQSRKATRSGGRIISLESQEDSGWQLISTAKSLKSLSDTYELGTSLVFNYYGEEYYVIFNSSQDSPSVSWSPVSRNATEDNHWCLMTINLMVTQKKE